LIRVTFANLSYACCQISAFENADSAQFSHFPAFCPFSGVLKGIGTCECAGRIPNTG
jgi:hypothetical protein